VVEPGTVATDILSHGRPEVLQPYMQRLSSIELLAAEDIANAICYIVTRPRRVAVNELLIRPTEEYW
jgi:NADP-dependent 3-hydroxy acid dehydrogenase YdfG